MSKKHTKIVNKPSCGTLTTDPYQMLPEKKCFLSNLYKTDDSLETSDSTEAFLNSLNIPQSSEEQKQSFKGSIAIEECRIVLETFQNNKSPGNAGLPIEFYKTGWDRISEPFVDCVNESFDTEEILLIEKKGKDCMLIENWRPISLVNVDAKIISKVIATRIKDVLEVEPVTSIWKF